MKKVLIANRGEIAVRIVRACKDAGLASVAVYADADSDAPFVRMADEAYALNGQKAGETYLDIGKLIGVAKHADADAVHPGYGFLSERAEFAQAVIDAGLTWIGPDPKVIETLGDKLQAREIARAVGAPLVKGSDGPVATAAEALAFALFLCRAGRFELVVGFDAAVPIVDMQDRQSVVGKGGAGRQGQHRGGARGNRSDLLHFLNSQLNPAVA